MNDRKTVVVVDDHQIFRVGVIESLRLSKKLEVVGEGASHWDAIRLVGDMKPDVVLIDISMPGNGVDAARAIHTKWPDVKVVMLTVSEEDDDVVRALEAGASGYVVKGIRAPDLIATVESVAGGGTYLSPNLGTRLFSTLRQQPDTERVADLLQGLSPREIETLRLTGRGLSNREIADELGIQVKTVKAHMSNLLKKLGIRNRVEAALIAQKHL